MEFLVAQNAIGSLPLGQALACVRSRSLAVFEVGRHGTKTEPGSVLNFARGRTDGHRGRRENGEETPCHATVGAERRGRGRRWSREAHRGRVGAEEEQGVAADPDEEDGELLMPARSRRITSPAWSLQAASGRVVFSKSGGGTLLVPFPPRPRTIGEHGDRAIPSNFRPWSASSGFSKDSEFFGERRQRGRRERERRRRWEEREMELGFGEVASGIL